MSGLGVHRQDGFPRMLRAAHPCLQEKLLATGLSSSCSVSGHAEHNTANSTKAKLAQAGTHSLREGRAQCLPATAGMKAEFRIVAEMLKFLSDKEGTR